VVFSYFTLLYETLFVVNDELFAKSNRNTDIYRSGAVVAILEKRREEKSAVPR
jgi:hypothetical protein